MATIDSDKLKDKVKYSCCGDVCSDALFGVSIAKVEGFRSQSHVNADEDMVYVKLYESILAPLPLPVAAN